MHDLLLATLPYLSVAIDPAQSQASLCTLAVPISYQYSPYWMLYEIVVVKKRDRSELQSKGATFLLKLNKFEYKIVVFILLPQLFY